MTNHPTLRSLKAALACAAIALCISGNAAHGVTTGSRYSAPPLQPAIDPYRYSNRLTIEAESLEPGWILRPYDFGTLETVLIAVRKARFGNCKHTADANKDDPARDELSSKSFYISYFSILDFLIPYQVSAPPRRVVRYDFGEPAQDAPFRQLEIAFVPNKKDLVIASVRIIRGTWTIEGSGITPRYQRSIESSDACVAASPSQSRSIMPSGPLVPDPGVNSGPVEQRPRVEPRPLVPMAF